MVEERYSAIHRGGRRPPRTVGALQRRGPHHQQQHQPQPRAPRPVESNAAHTAARLEGRRVTVAAGGAAGHSAQVRVSHNPYPAMAPREAAGHAAVLAPVDPQGHVRLSGPLERRPSEARPSCEAYLGGACAVVAMAGEHGAAALEWNSPRGQELQALDEAAAAAAAGGAAVERVVLGGVPHHVTLAAMRALLGRVVPDVGVVALSADHTGKLGAGRSRNGLWRLAVLRGGAARVRRALFQRVVFESASRAWVAAAPGSAAVRRYEAAVQVYATGEGSGQPMHALTAEAERTKPRAAAPAHWEWPSAPATPARTATPPTPGTPEGRRGSLSSDSTPSHASLAPW